MTKLDWPRVYAEISVAVFFFLFFFCHLPFWMDGDRNGLKRLLKLTFVAVNGILKRLLLSRMVVNSVAVLIFFSLAIDMYVSLLYLP